MKRHQFSLLLIILFMGRLADAAEFRFAVEPGNTLTYHANRAINEGSNSVTHAVIVVHGTDRNADYDFDRMHKPASDAGYASKSLILAPRFVTADDNPRANQLYWTSAGWKKGFRAVNLNRLSSFTVVDELVQEIVERHANLESLTLIGHSAGGQFVQRYAGLTDIDKLDSTLKIRFIAANPSSYAYLSPDRPASTGGCATFDEYKYSFRDADEALAYTTKNLEQIKALMLSRDIVVLAGERDKEVSSTLDVSCAALAQGDHRLERAENYYAYINELSKNHNHFFEIVPGVGHSSTGVFRSQVGLDETFLFDDAHRLARANRTFNRIESENPELRNGSQTKTKNLDGKIGYCRVYPETQSTVYLWTDDYIWLQLNDMDWMRLFKL